MLWIRASTEETFDDILSARQRTRKERRKAPRRKPVLAECSPTPSSARKRAHFSLALGFCRSAPRIYHPMHDRSDALDLVSQVARPGSLSLTPASARWSGR